MIAGFKSYPAYKSSGVEWPGEVPAHWEVRRLKAVFRERDERSCDGRETLLSLTRERGIVPHADVSTRVASASDLSKYKVCRSGDLVMNRMQAWSGMFAVSKEHGLVSPDYSVFESRGEQGTCVEYFGHLLKTPQLVEQFAKRSKGIGSGFNRLYTPDFGAVPVVNPPIDEQVGIARYLDYADRRIRRYISTKKELITLLEEQKQAIIHRAVTGQFDVQTSKPYPYKDSGVEWLGEVPAHWQVVALKRVLWRLVDCEHKTAPAVDESEYRVVRTTAVRGGRLRWEGTYCTNETAFRDWTKRAKPEPGDVIFTREAPAGEACVVPEDATLCLGQRTVLMSPQAGIYDPQFLVHMIYAGPPRERIRMVSQGSTVEHFNMDDIGWMRVLKPPFEEQLRLVEAIGDQTRDLDLAIASTEHEISLLGEYRTRLIADVVAGKLDVREVAACLSDETEEPVSSAESDALVEIDAEATYGLSAVARETEL